MSSSCNFLKGMHFVSFCLQSKPSGIRASRARAGAEVSGPVDGVNLRVDVHGRLAEVNAGLVFMTLATRIC